MTMEGRKISPVLYFNPGDEVDELFRENLLAAPPSDGMSIAVHQQDQDIHWISGSRNCLSYEQVAKIKQQAAACIQLGAQALLMCAHEYGANSQEAYYWTVQLVLSL